MARLTALILLSLAACPSAPKLRTGPIQAAVKHRLLLAGGKHDPIRRSTLAQRMTALHVPGVSLAVFQDGEIVWAAGSSWTHRSMEG